MSAFSVKPTATEEVALTENGALSVALPTPKSTDAGALNVYPERTKGRVGLFFHTVREIDNDKLRQLVMVSAEESVQDTIKILFYVRDGIRGNGKGEKEVFYQMWRIMTNDLGLGNLLLLNLELVPFYGSWKDLLQLCEKCENEDLIQAVVALFANKLKLLWGTIEETDAVLIGVDDSIGLVAKWAPTEKKSFDKKLKLAKRIRKRLGWSSQEYRQKLSIMRAKKVYVVERLMCKRKFETIEYGKVPGQAMKKYSRAFVKHDGERFDEFLADVKKELAKPETERSKKAKLNTKTLMPHEIYKSFLSNRNNQVEKEKNELLWKSKLQEVRQKLGSGLISTLCVSDVSGSMIGLPMDVSISLGLFLSELVSGQFYGHLITFSCEPSFYIVNPKHSLEEKFMTISQMDWGMNTNLQRVFELILETAVQYKLKEDELPQQILILSDMEFDEAVQEKTNWKVIKERYEQLNFKIPKVVFWNLRSSSFSFHTPCESDEENVALISGFNPSVLKAVMECEIPTPEQIMREAIDEARYDKITYE